MYKFCTFLFLYDEIIFSKKEKKIFLTVDILLLI